MRVAGQGTMKGLIPKCPKCGSKVKYGWVKVPVKLWVKCEKCNYEGYAEASKN
jgi:uncharacterized protein (DUF983 family)